MVLYHGKYWRDSYTVSLPSVDKSVDLTPNEVLTEDLIQEIDKLNSGKSPDRMVFT